MGKPTVATGAHFVRKRLRTGFVWYVYAWRGGPQVLKTDGPTKPKRLAPEVLKAIATAQETRAAPQQATLRSLIRSWRSNDPDRPSSPHWDRLAATTKKTWGSALDHIEDKWGDVPLAIFNDPRMKAKVVQWRDSRAATPRAADIGVTVLKSLLNFGVLHGKVVTNVAAGIPSLYAGGDRAEIIWTDDELARFYAKAEEIGLRGAADGLRLAVATGLRREDLVTLTWEHVGEFSIAKKALKRSRGRRRYATVVRIAELDALLNELATRTRQDNVNTVLVDDAGAPWTPDRLTKAVAKVRDELGICYIDPETGIRRKKHLHDARGTFATKLMTTTPVTDQQIAEMMGWSPEEVSRIRNVYVDRTAVVVALGERIRRAV
jgi:integrase